MNYPLAVISRIETDTKDRLVALTFYPSDTACIQPREYEVLQACCIRHFEPGLALADMVSEKGRRRLKILLRNPSFTDDERRSLGTMYFGLLFGQEPGGDEGKKGAADALYQAMCDLYGADISGENAWAAACEAALTSIRHLADRYYA